MRVILLLNTLLLRLKKNSDSGFTLLELLIVLIIMGVLAGVALPNMLGAVSKSKQAAPKVTLKAVNDAQIAYRAQYSKFGGSMGQIEVGMPSSTTDYQYEIKGENDVATIIAKSKDTKLKGYSGAVVMYTAAGSNSSNVQVASIICEADSPGIEAPALPVLNPKASTPEEAAKCADTTKPLS